ncbi:hypothetical protein [Actinoplanes sp. NPDC051859]|uniref:hypothetical protein n=1 Tax=Actinoplanes sp. NPDC051859 TaxID=3363909 RepID=UPI0037902BBE
MLFDTVLPQVVEAADQLSIHAITTAQLIGHHAGALLEEITRSTDAVLGTTAVNGGCSILAPSEL